MAGEIVASEAHEIDWRCGTCRFYDRKNETQRDLISDRELHKDDYEAECRRFPPVRGDAEYCGEMVGCKVLSESYCWPTVRSVDWCGEWASCDRAPDKGAQSSAEQKIDPILMRPIEDLLLTVRSESCLRALNVFYVGDLIQLTASDLLKLPNMSRKSLNEIQEALAGKCLLTLGMKLEDSLRSEFEKLKLEARSAMEGGAK